MNIKEPIIVEQTFNVSIKTIWNAITDIIQMRKWFFENISDFKPEIVEMDGIISLKKALKNTLKIKIHSFNIK